MDDPFTEFLQQFREICRGAHSREKSAANRKKSIFRFWHPLMQNFTLIPKMGLFLGFGAPGGRRKHFKIAKWHFCNFATERPSQGEPLGKFREIPFLSGSWRQTICSRWKNRIYWNIYVESGYIYIFQLGFVHDTYQCGSAYLQKSKTAKLVNRKDFDSANRLNPLAKKKPIYNYSVFFHRECSYR